MAVYDGEEHARHYHSANVTDIADVGRISAAPQEYFLRARHPP